MRLDDLIILISIIVIRVISKNACIINEPIDNVATAIFILKLIRNVTKQRNSILYTKGKKRDFIDECEFSTFQCESQASA